MIFKFGRGFIETIGHNQLRTAQVETIRRWAELGLINIPNRNFNITHDIPLYFR